MKTTKDQPLLMLGICLGCCAGLAIIAWGISNQPDHATANLARSVNAFAARHSMTTEEALRWHYVLSENRLTLLDLSDSLDAIASSRERATGRRFKFPAPPTTPLREGAILPAQDPVLTSDEAGIVATLKAAGY